MTTPNLGEAHVGITPDLTGFRAALERELSAAVRGVGPGAFRGVESSASSAGREAGNAFSRRFHAATNDLGRRIGGALKAGAIVGGVAVTAGIATALHTGIGEVADFEKGMAQLKAGIASTGGVVGLTAKQMQGLAASIEETTGQTDDSIVAAEQLLLTFCLEETAQALTPDRGWVSHDALNAGDLILGYDPADDAVRWERVDSIHRFLVDSDEMVRWRSKQIDVLSTPHHKWWTVGLSDAESRGFRTTREISGHQIRVKIGGGIPDCFLGEPIWSDEIIELAGWIVTEGWTQWARPSERGCNGASFSQSATANPEHVKTIRGLLDRLRAQGHRITEREDVARYNGSTMVTWALARDLGATLRGLLPDKKLTMALLGQITAGQARLLLDTLLAGDGHTDQHGHSQYIQKDPGQLDAVAALAAMLGVRTTDVPSRANTLAGSVYFNSTNHAFGHRMHAEREHYAGTVWCPHIRPGVWLARVRGRTFWTGNTNVTDQAGRGNDIFSQTTKLTADLAARLGGDASGAAIQLGKALNDPIKGISALTRVGVSFTDQQKTQIAALVESGDVLGAQKVVIAELNKEFGGSAEAVGKTLPGQLAILKRSFEGVAQGVVSGLIPAIKPLLPVLGEIVDALGPALTAVAGPLADALGPIIENLAPALTPIADLIGTVLATAGPVLADLAGLFTDIVTAVEPFISALVDGLGPILETIITAFADALLPVLPELTDALLTLIPPTLELVQVLADLFAEIAPEVIAAFTDVLLELLPVLVPLLGLLADVLGILEPLFPAIGKIVQITTLLLSPVRLAALAFDQLRGPLGAVADKFTDVGKAIGRFADRVLGALTGLPGKVAGIVGDIVGAVAGLPGRIGGLAGEMRDAGAGLIGGLINGLKHLGSGAAGIGAAIVNGIRGLVNTQIIDRINSLLSFTVKIPLAPDVHVNPPDIPHLARGAVLTRPTFFLGGEGGAEVVIPLTKPRRARQLAEESGLIELLAGRGAAPGEGRVLHFHLPSGDPEAIAAAVSNRQAALSGVGR